jgi:hypothetical protein
MIFNSKKRFLILLILLITGCENDKPSNISFQPSLEQKNKSVIKKVEIQTNVAKEPKINIALSKTLKNNKAIQAVYIEDGNNVLASINHNKPTFVASAIKLPVVLAFLKEKNKNNSKDFLLTQYPYFNNGKKWSASKLLDDVFNYKTDSNLSTNTLVEQLGCNKLKGFLPKNTNYGRYMFSPQSCQGGSNTSTPLDVTQSLKKLATLPGTEYDYIRQLMAKNKYTFPYKGHKYSKIGFTNSVIVEAFVITKNNKDYYGTVLFDKYYDYKSSSSVVQKTMNSIYDNL